MLRQWKGCPEPPRGGLGRVGKWLLNDVPRASPVVGLPRTTSYEVTLQAWPVFVLAKRLVVTQVRVVVTQVLVVRFCLGKTRGGDGGKVFYVFVLAKRVARFLMFLSWKTRGGDAGACGKAFVSPPKW